MRGPSAPLGVAPVGLSAVYWDVESVLTVMPVASSPKSMTWAFESCTSAYRLTVSGS